MFELSNLVSNWFTQVQPYRGCSEKCCVCSSKNGKMLLDPLGHARTPGFREGLGYMNSLQKKAIAFTWSPEPSARGTCTHYWRLFSTTPQLRAESHRQETGVLGLPIMVGGQ